MARRAVLPLLFALYFSQGLPFGFFSDALPVLLRDAGYTLVQISATGLLFAPWALKFLWAPYVDRFGTRRRWLLVLQLTSAAGALALATLDLSSSLRWLFVVVAGCNVLAATQDIATDGLAVTLLGPRDRGLGNGIQTGAYRVGMVAGGGLLLWLYALSGWRMMFLVMAGLLLVATIPVFLLREPTRQPFEARPRSSWWKRLNQPGFAAFAALIVIYKFGDSMGSALVGPYMSDTGISLANIALVKGTIASASVLVGAAIGGWLAYRHGRRTALLVGGLLQTAALAAYLPSALGLGGFWLIVAGVIAEQVLGGIATVALFTLMMDASDVEHAGSDYTLLASAIVIGQGAASMAAGVVGQAFGYPTLFGSSFVLSLAGCLALIVALDRGVGPSRLHPTWARQVSQ